ncbi:MAG TPA: hypothetical protein VII83_02325 [Gaiellaceae bacterium]
MPLGRDRADAGVALRRRPDSPVMNRSTTEASSSLAIVIEYVRELRVAFIGVLVTLIVAPFAMLPYLADDTINRGWANYSWSKSLHDAVTINRQFIHEQGRFFPGGTIYGVPMWHLLDTRVTYMTFVVLLNLACLGLVGFVLLQVTRSADVTAIGVIALGACMQIRWVGPDGLSSFSGLIPYTIVLTILSGLGAAQILRTGRRWWLIPTAIAWTLSVTAYEVTLLMLPAMIVLLFVANRGRDRIRWMWALAPLVIPAVAEAAIDFYLHSRATAPVPAYQVDLSGPVGSTFLKQLTAALPSSQHWLRGTPTGTHLSPALSVMLVLLLAFPTFLAWRRHFAVKAIPQRLSIGLIVAGSWAWLVPSLLTSVTRRWQTELVFGQGYISLPYEYVGVALILAGVAGLLSGRLRSRGVRIAVVTMLALVLIGCAITVGSNLVYAGQYVPGPPGPEGAPPTVF